MAPTVTIEYTESKGVGVKMGKSRKVSKGYSSGFVPDYRHAVETMAESEGFGSSGRVDIEMAASENSYAPKRKGITTNDQDRFGVPLQFLSLSKMSRTDRKDLELRLRNELEQVRILQRRITSTGMNSLVHSPTSDIHSYSDGLKRPPVQDVERSAANKKRSLGKNGPRTKGAGSKRVEPVKPSLPPNANNVMLMKQCDTLLKRLMEHECGWIFNEPVDIVKLNIPHYFTVIKHPMDFSTIKSKLHAGLYADISGFADDVRLTFNNAMKFNPPGHDVHLMAKTLSKFFEMRWKPIEKKKITSNAGQLLTPRPAVSLQTNTVVPMPSSKKAKSTPVENLVQPENKVKQVGSAVDRQKVMSAVDRNKLSADLEPLIEELPESIVDFLKRCCSNASKANEDEAERGSEDEIEIDVDALDDDTSFILRKLLDDYISDKKKNQTKDTHNVVLQNESGLSTSFPEPQKGNDLADEEVDIGGDDLPSSFPPIEIDKDTTHRNSKNNSSSGSSSNSDSETGSSSSGDSDVVKDTASPGTQKDVLGSGVHDETTMDAAGEDTLKSIARQDTEPVMAPAEANIQAEAESVSLERTVSPEKLYRAALLRSRFADTIIKAQEKTLEKSDKLDPEKLRLEREELEKRRREEKARLQAEAKAAEEARKKVEEAAAEEARKKRELEREAARQALQKMEKTVDINENSQFMEDLEMFRSAPDEHLASFIEETSPDHSQDGLGSFNFQGSNPLMEKLGLYRKKDEEEEEETEPLGIPKAAHDPEEGEID